MDADFDDKYDGEDSKSQYTERSGHGYIVMYKGCPVIWKSQLQIEICLLSAESGKHRTFTCTKGGHNPNVITARN